MCHSVSLCLEKLEKNNWSMVPWIESAISKNGAVEGLIEIVTTS
jgi:hypothetical protein